MNRAEFMQKLGALLGDVEINERTDALKYYADYFDDAGEENESKVIEELGSPDKVAKIIKAELSAKEKERGEFTEAGYKNPAYEENAAVVAAKAGNYNQNTQTHNTQNQNVNGQTTSSQSHTTTAPKNDAGKIVLIILLCIFAIPVGIPVLGAAFSIVIGIFSTIFGLIVGFGAAAIGFIISGIVLLIVGFVNIIAAPFASFVLIAISLFLTALGILFMILTVLICGKLLPAICRGIVYVFSAPFKRREAVA